MPTAQAFLAPALETVPVEALQQHIQGASKALLDVEKQIKGWKRKMNAQKQRVALLRSMIPVKVKLVPVANEVSTVMWSIHASHLNYIVCCESRLTLKMQSMHKVHCITNLSGTFENESIPYTYTYTYQISCDAYA